MQFQPSERIAEVGQKYLAIQQEQIKQLKRKGVSIINLGRGNPDQPTFKPIVDQAKTELNNPINHGYPPYGGNQTLKTSIKSFYKQEYRVDLADDEITVFSGSTAALTALPMVLANPEDIVLTPTPAFFAYHIGITMSGAGEWQLPLLKENNFLPDLDAIPEHILKKSKLLFLNYPHNPTGAGATTAFFNKAVQFGKKHHIAIIHDFAYADISFEQKAPSFLQSPGAKDTGIEIYTFSKTFNMAGWRCAFAVGNPSIIKLLKQYIQNSVGGTFGTVQNAGGFALLHQKEQRQKLRSRYLTRRNAALNALKQCGMHASKSSGTFFIWAKLPDNIYDDKAFAKELLNYRHVAIVPGSAFGETGKGYIRISLVSPTQTIIAGIHLLANFANNYQESRDLID